MDPFLAAVRQTLAAGEMIPPDDGSFLVAVSGGPDSVALLAALLDLGHRVVAAHFNHGWRGAASDADQDHVRRLCEELGEELVVGSATMECGDSSPLRVRRGTRAKGGWEQAARDARYAFLLAAARERGCARIATGHTRDDQAETVLLRLLRGSGATGLAGIQPHRADGVVRPLLGVERGDVLAFLQRRGLHFVEDASNRERRFARNRLRLDVMPLLRQLEPRVTPILAGFAEKMAAVAALERALADDVLRTAVDAAGGLVVVHLAGRPLALRRLAARAWLQRRRGDLRRLEAAHFEAVASCDRSGSRVALPRGEAVVNEHGVLRFVSNSTPEAVESRQLTLSPGETIQFGGSTLTASAIEDCSAGASLPTNLSQAVFDADQTALPLEVRRWRAGDRVQPLGMRGHRKLSDVFGDAKLPRWRRHALPIVAAGGHILWVPGVVRSADAIIGPHSRRLLRLEVVVP